MKSQTNLAIGDHVEIILKADQKTDKRTRGHVKKILTRNLTHPHGRKVMLVEGNAVGRVKIIL